MTQDTFEAKYNVTKKTKAKIFFDKYKIAIPLMLFPVIIATTIKIKNKGISLRPCLSRC